MFFQHTILAVSHIVLLGLSFSACDALIQYSLATHSIPLVITELNHRKKDKLRHPCTHLNVFDNEDTIN